MNPFIRTFGKANEIEAFTVHAMADTNHLGEVIKQSSVSSIEAPALDSIEGESFSVSPALTSALQDVLEKITAYKSTATPHNAAKQKFSTRIVLGKHTDIMPAVCSETGSVVGILFPVIPNKSFTYKSPLAIFANARDIANEGPAFLRKLDAQTLAAILLTLAREYNLFRSAHSDTGAQKNAILRTVERNVLIDAIILIAGHIHSVNCTIMPKLSLILDVEVADKGIHVRMVNWLSVLTDMIYRPQADVLEEQTEWNHPAPEKQITAPTISRANKEKAALRKDFKLWAKTSKDTITAIAAKGSISAKLKSFLLAVLTEDTLTSADPTLISLMCQKLESLNLHAATMLSFGLKKYHEHFNAVAASDEFSSPNFAASVPGTPIVDVSEEDDEFGTTAAKISIAAFSAATEPKASNSLPFGDKKLQAHAQNYSTGAVSFAERIRLKREAALLANADAIAAAPQINAIAADTAQEDQDAPF